jgi:riboflavin kinase/FMN adenylyltransferase
MNMKVTLIHEAIELKNAVATIGIFDGVHRGHQFILSHLKEQAKRHNGESVVVTLWPHPRIVLDRNVEHFRLLHAREEKIRELEKNGIDHLVIIPFNKEIASLTACQFVQAYLVDHLQVKVLLMGYDNRFGSDRAGDPDGLISCAEENRFTIEKLPEFNSSSGRLSSTAIRDAIFRGDLDLSRSMLGYDYYLNGSVVEGNHIGRKIGFPTANIHPTDPYKMIPMNGVYAIRAELLGRSFGGMLNIGFRPTIDSASAVKTIEAHLFEASGDFYDERIVIHFIKRVRDEMKFSGMEQLKEQLGRDKESVLTILNTH